MQEEDKLISLKNNSQCWGLINQATVKCQVEDDDDSI